MRVLLIPLLLAPAAGCLLDDPDLGPPAPPIVTSGEYHHFVQRGWILPNTSAEARAMAFDVDDRGSKTDNALGSLIALLTQIGLETQLTSDDAFASGALVVMHSVRADSLVDDSSVTLRVLHGLSDGVPRFDGNDRLTMLADDGLLAGSIRDRVLDADFGAVTLRLPFFPDQPPLVIPIIAARVELTAGPDGDLRQGRIGGALRPAELEEVVLPRLGDAVVLHMARHPEHDFTMTAHTVFDANDDGAVTAAEVVELSRSLIRPDVDLTNDGTSDAISIALAFETAPAQFTAVGE